MKKVVEGLIAFILFYLIVIPHTSCQSSQAQFESIIKDNPHFSIWIAGGKIIDGSGCLPFPADLLIREDTIAFIGVFDTSKIEYERKINAFGKFITPGFIDLHAHGDPLSNRSKENFLAMGVTTIVLGMDGSSPVSIHAGYKGAQEYLKAVSNRPLPLNMILFEGHGSIRTKAGISATGPASMAQIEQMNSLLSKSLDAGCWGLSTGLEYVPGMYADTAELHSLARTVGRYNGIIMSHIRNEDDDLLEASIQELIDQGAFCKVHISHLKSVYGKGPARGTEILEMINNARRSGIEITADMYPYLASFTGIGIVFPKWAKTRQQFIQARDTRNQELRDYLKNRVLKRNGPGATRFGSGPYTGITLEQAANQKGVDYVDILMELGPAGASAAYFIMDASLQETLLKDPMIMFCTDGSVSMRHPRGYGTFARILKKYVVEDSLLSLPLAIHKMSSLPSHFLGLDRRGEVKIGNFADLNIFELKNIEDRATFGTPHRLAKGFDWVMINGKISWSDSKCQNKAGKLLKPVRR